MNARTIVAVLAILALLITAQPVEASHVHVEVEQNHVFAQFTSEVDVYGDINGTGIADFLNITSDIVLELNKTTEHYFEGIVDALNQTLEFSGMVAKSVYLRLELLRIDEYTLKLLMNVTIDVVGAISVSGGKTIVDLRFRSMNVEHSMNCTHPKMGFSINYFAMYVFGATTPYIVQVLENATITVNGQEVSFQELWAYLAQLNTFNFSALGQRLEEWHREYDPEANETRFTYDAGLYFNVTVAGGTENFYLLLEVVADPSGEIVVDGYAVASGDNLVVYSSPEAVPTPSLVPAIISALGVAISILAARKRYKSD